MKTIGEIFNGNNQIVKRSVFLSLSFINVYFYTRYFNYLNELGAVFYLFALVNVVFFAFCIYKFFYYDTFGYGYIALGVVLLLLNVFYLRSLQNSLSTFNFEGEWTSDDSLGLTLKFDFRPNSICYLSQSPDYEKVEYEYVAKGDSLYILDFEDREIRFSFKVENKSCNSMVLEMEDEAIVLERVFNQKY